MKKKKKTEKAWALSKLHKLKPFSVEFEGQTCKQLVLVAVLHVDYWDHHGGMCFIPPWVHADMMKEYR